MNYVHEYSQILESKRELITAWMKKKRNEVPIPIYGSVDVRDAGWKVAVVDANHFPAGFNNVSKEDEPHLAALLKIIFRDLNPNVNGSIYILNLILGMQVILRM